MVVEPARHLFTVDEYERMGAMGLFRPGQRLELLAGEIVEMAPIGSLHADTVNRLNEWFVLRLSGRAVVSVQNSARVSDLTEPQPDLMLLRPLGKVYRSRTPGPEDVLLLIEVSDSTARFDRRVKRPLYAAAGIAEMWVVDLQGGLVEVAVHPSPEGYTSVQQVRPGGLATPEAFPDLALPVAEFVT